MDKVGEIKMTVRRVISIAMIFLMLASTTILATNTSDRSYESEATTLKNLGLFEGTSAGFELDKRPTRAEAAVMMVRLLGAEKDASAVRYKYPFKDVKSWAAPYIGYMYEKGLSKGISTDMYGSSDYADSKSYASFILRALGYDDNSGDFDWNTSLSKLVELGIIDNNDPVITTETFTRNDIVHLSYHALFANMKDGPLTLQAKLYFKGVIPTTVYNGDENSIDAMTDLERVELTANKSLFEVYAYVNKVGELDPYKITIGQANGKTVTLEDKYIKTKECAPSRLKPGEYCTLEDNDDIGIILVEFYICLTKKDMNRIREISDLNYGSLSICFGEGAYGNNKDECLKVYIKNEIIVINEGVPWRGYVFGSINRSKSGRGSYGADTNVEETLTISADVSKFTFCTEDSWDSKLGKFTSGKIAVKTITPGSIEPIIIKAEDWKSIN